MIEGTVLVTGAAGFVGPHLSRALAAAGARTVGLGIESEPPPGTSLEGWRTADVRALDPLVEALADVRPAAVVHLAGQSSAARSFADPEGTFRLNVEGTRNLLEAVRRVVPRCRVLVIGSGEVYGPQPEGSRVTEDAPFAPVSPYARSKADADALAADLARAHGLDVIRVRAFSHAGPGQSRGFVLPDFASQIAAIEAGRGEPILRVGNLEVTRDLTDVRDVVRAYAALLERGASGEAYNVCRGEGVSLAGVVRRLVSLARGPIGIEPDPARMRPADVPWLVGDPGRLGRAVGWAPAIPLEVTLADTLDDWRRRAGRD